MKNIIMSVMVRIEYVQQQKSTIPQVNYLKHNLFIRQKKHINCGLTIVEDKKLLLFPLFPSAQKRIYMIALFPVTTGSFFAAGSFSATGF